MVGILIGQEIFPKGGGTSTNLSSTDDSWFQTDTHCVNDPIRFRGNPTCTVKLRPRKMSIEFVDREQFDKMAGIPKDGEILGFTRYLKRPCEIVMPLDGLSITYQPYVAGGWPRLIGDNHNSYGDGERTIIHEILHCYIGDWHADVFYVLWREELVQYRWRRSHDANNLSLPTLAVNTWDKRTSYENVEIYNLRGYKRPLTAGTISSVANPIAKY